MNIMKKAGTLALATMCSLTPVASVPVLAATSDSNTNNTAVSKDLKDNDIIDYSMNVDAERGGGFYEIKL